MTSDAQVRNLEDALLARARALVREHLDKAAAQREHLLAEVAQRLRLAEEREILAAKVEADRAFRRRVQAAEIRMQGELDRLRWTLVQAVLASMQGVLATLVADEARYVALLSGYLRSAAPCIGADPVLVALNARDRDRFAVRWDALFGDAAPPLRLELAEAPHSGSGGVIVRDAQDSVRIDDTFEGRLDRLGEAVHAAVLERLFAAVPHMEAVFHG